MCTEVIHYLELHAVLRNFFSTLLSPIIIHYELLLFFSFSRLLFVVLNVYSESSQHVKLPDPIVVTLPNSSCTLASLAPILFQIEVFGSVLPQNWVFKIAQPQNEVLKAQNKEILAQIKHF
jgi:hypothetical protein